MKRYLFALLVVTVLHGCEQHGRKETPVENTGDTIATIFPDTMQIPEGKFGEAVRYGRALFINTAYYIGPNGINGKYTGNKMNCTQCHQQAGTKPFSFNLVKTHERYPMYRAREGTVLSLAERINNCVTRPHNGIPVPLESKEMIAMLSYLKWINEKAPKETWMEGEEGVEISFPGRAADPERGKLLYTLRCKRCHGAEGEGKMDLAGIAYQYPPLWGPDAYQPGSSMHRVIKQAQWIKANMPYDSATWQKPVLTDEDAFDIAAFVNDDRIHKRPDIVNQDYPYAEDKAIDYGKGPYVDTFPELQHKFGPYGPIVSYWKSKGLNPRF